MINILGAFKRVLHTASAGEMKWGGETGLLIHLPIYSPPHFISPTEDVKYCFTPAAEVKQYSTCSYHMYPEFISCHLGPIFVFPMTQTTKWLIANPK